MTSLSRPSLYYLFLHYVVLLVVVQKQGATGFSPVSSQFSSTPSLSKRPPTRTNTVMKTMNVDLSDPITFGIFFLWGSPVPILFSSLISEVETLEAGPSPKQLVNGQEQKQDPMNMLYAFPSFGSQMVRPPEPSILLGPPGSVADRAVRWFFALNVYAGIGWYLYYKYQVENELQRRSGGEGLGGAVVVLPFTVGLSLGIIGQVLYGSLENGLWDNVFSSAFWLGFLWIYIQQFVLYEKVNALYEAKGLPKPLETWGLLVPGYNFVTGIRQIHFLSALWTMERGEEPVPDPFCALFPFTTKPQLGVIELFTNSELWISPAAKSVLEGWWKDASELVGKTAKKLK